MVLAGLLVGCSSAPAESEPVMETKEAVQTESERANAFFERIFNEAVMRSPTYQSYLGIKKDQDKWNDNSDENAQKELAITKAALKELRETIDYDALDEQAKVSYRLFEEQSERQIRRFKYRFHSYPVNQMFGAQSGIPSFLINIHRVSEVADAEAYISRLHGVEGNVAQVIESLQIREKKGIMAPKFVYPYTINDIDNVLSGQPFEADASEDSALYTDFKGKVNGLDIEQPQKDALIAQAHSALLTSFKPAFLKLRAQLVDMETRATTDDGAWKLPEGDAFYAMALRDTTTTDMSAEDIHDLGLAEVARIHDEMRAIMRKVGFDGTLQDFFEFTRTDSRFYYDETADGKQRYLDEATAMIDTMKGELDSIFITKPKADLVVKAVEAFREKSAGKAFYQQPAPDGSRPGTYYANLYKMSSMPVYQMEALAYHEGIPGHHMQIAIAQELEGVPKFRKYGRYTAYTEGWGLYSEYIPKEMGFYQDPYSDFGRLAMELWRACRLVVDTGIHDKKWTREEAIEYLSTNTPNPTEDVVKAIERYIVMPSQATAYKVGMIRILELRADAKERLGDRFDIREFHDVVLRQGPLPLSVLEEFVDDYVERNL
ncbi:MAG: DUF885 domain-containing protein [Pseudomonadota bacterium]